MPRSRRKTASAGANRPGAQGGNGNRLLRPPASTIPALRAWGIVELQSTPAETAVAPPKNCFCSRKPLCRGTISAIPCANQQAKHFEVRNRNRNREFHPKNSLHTRTALINDAISFRQIRRKTRQSNANVRLSRWIGTCAPACKGRAARCK